MKYFAKIENNKVTQVIVSDSIEWINQNLVGNWLETKIDGSLRYNFAAIDYDYDQEKDVFIPPKPQSYPSWVLNDNFNWQAPTPMPTEGEWYWDESSLSWVEGTIL
jgi:hypothetical protein